jgi:hypothetical protein
VDPGSRYDQANGGVRRRAERYSRAFLFLFGTSVIVISVIIIVIIIAVVVIIVVVVIAIVIGKTSQASDSTRRLPAVPSRALLAESRGVAA